MSPALTDARTRAGRFLLRHGHRVGQKIDAGRVQDYLEEYEQRISQLEAQVRYWKWEAVSWGSPEFQNFEAEL